ncbi:nucleoside triphosphate pyrophosphohydrolase [Roseiflexus castenholzii]|jgi:tetrapyrrole methylase family protein/MazG family protein|uniref:MazG family protein n=1 Tax=Roseiflexus castenholzii (strain DSM 13941 / HLO8) TaxID=383372 RepID=A7NJP3_ROSCS|nr:nucleoside triphosphate pyrophosphohydrolase [Roseiflexus castenholzii]ABU57713.1 MazG family protein [Roseiflexus castenholzii DSM 13941]
MITLVGLGPGDPGLITRAAWEMISAARVLYLRTAVHPTVAALPPSVVVRAFDDLYEQAERFDEVYERIADELIARARGGEAVVYATPGDPLTAEATSRHLLRRARAQGVPARVVPGVSFVEPVCALLGVDPLEHGLQLLDALDLMVGDTTVDAPSWASLHGFTYTPPLLPFPLTPTRPALICQVYSRSVASHVKLSLLERYPVDHLVTLVRAAGVVDAEAAVELPLHTLDHRNDFDHLTSLFVPPLTPLADLRGPDGVAYVVARLLGPGGCPWDREQTPQSLRASLLEEVHEALEALDAGNDEALVEELGDVLINVLMLSEMARQAERFDAGEVFNAVAGKLIRRHPHVFGELDVAASDQVLHNWEAIKRAEHATKGVSRQSALDGIPPSLPALAAAQKVVSKAARAGFDAPEIDHAWDALAEELAELRAVTTDPAQAEAELGDLLLAVARLGWRLDVDAESALRAAVARFRRRFARLETLLNGRDLRSLSIDEKLALWERARDDG